MIHAVGTARIRHAETGEIYDIDGELLQFEVVAVDERNMGLETAYSAVLHHPQLGQLVWSIWEYPVGAENYRETDVGPHKLLENVDFGLGHDPPDDVDVDRQARVNALVEWFFQHYEDPVHRLPYVTAEGGYQWIHGGPYDAGEELANNFPDESEEIIEAAINEIEADGLSDWAPVAGPDDYDHYDDDPREDEDQSDIVRDLESSIADLPEPASEPVFRLGDDGLIHMATPPDAAAPAESDGLISELRASTSDLLDALSGTNAHTGLLSAVQRYDAAICGEAISISGIYARGVRLTNAAAATHGAIVREDLPPLPQDAETHLSSVLDLNGAYVMSQPEGRDLAEGLDANRRTPDETQAMREAARRFAEAVRETPHVFGEDVQEYVSEAAADVGRGPQPDRSNQLAAVTLSHLTLSLFRHALSIGATATIGAMVVASGLGAEMVVAGAGSIDFVWAFLVENAPKMRAIAGAFGADLSWMAHVAKILEQLKRH